MPVYDVVERHHVRIAAPADAVLAAACTQDLWQSRVTRAIFRAREIVLGATPSFDLILPDDRRAVPTG